MRNLGGVRSPRTYVRITRLSYPPAMVKVASAPLTAPIPRQRKPSKSAEASGWWPAAGAAGLALVGTALGLVLGLSLP